MTFFSKPTRWLRLLALASAVLIAGCSSVEVTDYAKNQPKFDLPEFFSGHLKAHGILKNRSGKVIRYFNADLVGEWKNGIGTLNEDFVFNDGEKQHRTWTMTPDENGHYSATANDVVGTGQINQAGNAMFMKYVLEVPYKGDTLDVHVDDRMYRVNDNVVINESVLSKFGFNVGYLTLVIEKVKN